MGDTPGVRLLDIGNMRQVLENCEFYLHRTNDIAQLYPLTEFGREDPMPIILSDSQSFNEVSDLGIHLKIDDDKITVKKMCVASLAIVVLADYELRKDF